MFYALILLACDEEGHQQRRSKNKDVAWGINTSMMEIDCVRKRFILDGFDVAFHGKKGSWVYVKKADAAFDSHLVALSCSNPPECFARWTLRLMVTKADKLDYIDSISHDPVRRLLKRTNLSLGHKSICASASREWPLYGGHRKGAGRVHACSGSMICGVDSWTTPRDCRC